MCGPNEYNTNYKPPRSDGWFAVMRDGCIIGLAFVIAFKIPALFTVLEAIAKCPTP